MSPFEEQLKGGHPNSLGNTIKVVEQVLKDPSLFDQFFNCYFSDDEVVRLRVSNGMKRICKANSALLLPYLDRFIKEIAEINQASTQWTLAQLFKALDKDLSPKQKKEATEIMQRNLAQHEDWIVLNQTMDTLGSWAREDSTLKAWIIPHLDRLSADSRKSVSKKANKVRASLS